MFQVQWPPLVCNCQSGGMGSLRSGESPRNTEEQLTRGKEQLRCPSGVCPAWRQESDILRVIFESEIFVISGGECMDMHS